MRLNNEEDTRESLAIIDHSTYIVEEETVRYDG